MYVMIEGGLEVKLPTIWTDGKAEVGRGREEKSRREKIREEKEREERRKKMQVREKIEKSRSTVFFQWFVAPEGRKVGSLKRRVQRHLARWEMKSSFPRQLGYKFIWSLLWCHELNISRTMIWSVSIPPYTDCDAVLLCTPTSHAVKNFSVHRRVPRFFGGDQAWLSGNFFPWHFKQLQPDPWKS